VSLTDALPAGLSGATYCTEPPSASPCDASAGSAWASPLALGRINVGQSVTIRIHATVNANVANNALLTNTATVSSSAPLWQDPNDASNGTNNNTASAFTTVYTQADLSITKSDSADPATAGTNLTYTLTATNNGPSDAQNVSIADTTPTGTTFVSATPSAGGSCGSLVAGGTGLETCTWAGATTPGASRTVTSS
jgi:uncharacterized repeat protein (TIGR01451 family)